MKISKVWREKLNERDEKEYNFEYTGDITLRVDGYEIAKDWIDPEFYDQIHETLTLALTDSIRTNKNPLFEYKEKTTKEERYILSVVAQYSYLNLDPEHLILRCMKKTKLSKEEVVRVITERKPEFATLIGLLP